jgi:hypothetical protein
MKLFLIALVVFATLYFVSPDAFNKVGKILDAPRCAIGMDYYCNRKPTPDFRKDFMR